LIERNSRKPSINEKQSQTSMFTEAHPNNVASCLVSTIARGKSEVLTRTCFDSIDAE